jgi:hypothetical protein
LTGAGGVSGEKKGKEEKEGKEKGEKNINFVSVRSFVIELIRSFT